jgi:aromatic ring hydroxylase
MMRTGTEYRASLRDGRNVWVLGDGPIDDVTTHLATVAMVDEYAAWYDRHFDTKSLRRASTPSRRASACRRSCAACLARRC